MLDLGQLLPHGKKDAKLDTKSERGAINEVADLKVRGRGRVGGRAARGCGGWGKTVLADDGGWGFPAAQPCCARGSAASQVLLPVPAASSAA